MSDEHFTVDGTLIEAAASLKSFRPKDQPPSDEPPDDPGNPTVNFRGERRSNTTHQSTTDPEARLAKKGRGFESKLAYMGPHYLESGPGKGQPPDGVVNSFAAAWTWRSKASPCGSALTQRDTTSGLSDVVPGGARTSAVLR